MQSLPVEDTENPTLRNRTANHTIVCQLGRRAALVCRGLKAGSLELHRAPRLSQRGVSIVTVGSFHLSEGGQCIHRHYMHRNQQKGDIENPWPILTGGTFADFAQRSKDAESLCESRPWVDANSKDGRLAHAYAPVR